MPHFVHTPYDGSSKPFTIGLKPLDIADWIEIDAGLEDVLAEKDRLYRNVPDDVFVEEPDTGESQRELLDLLVAHIVERHPQTYQRRNDHILIGESGRHVDLSASSPPLRVASLLVPEDLILMREHVDGWRLVAGSLCFPSSWSLREKFGKPLHDIHQPIPGFARGTRTAGIIDRIFNKLPVDQPVQRFNWSLQAGSALHEPLAEHERVEREAAPSPRFPHADVLDNTFIRVERQTLRKLPQSGDIVFSIRIYLDPLEFLERHPGGHDLAATFAAQLIALDEAQLGYKGLTADRDRLVSALDAIAPRPRR